MGNIDAFSKMDRQARRASLREAAYRRDERGDADAFMTNRGFDHPWSLAVIAGIPNGLPPDKGENRLMGVVVEAHSGSVNAEGGGKTESQTMLFYDTFMVELLRKAGVNGVKVG